MNKLPNKVVMSANMLHVLQIIIIVIVFYLSVHRQTVGNKTKTDSQKIPRSSELAAYKY